MNHNYKLAIAAVIVTTLTACSSADRRRQANNDFNYLDTQPLESWTQPEGARAFDTNVYAIPTQSFSGEIGSQVDIRPPAEILNLIPGARSFHDQEGVTMLLPSSAEMNRLWNVTKQMITKRDVKLLSDTTNEIKTDWVSWTDEEKDAKISSRFDIVRSPAENSFRIKLAAMQQDGKDVAITPAIQARSSITVANIVSVAYDQQLRDEAAARAQEMLKHVPITMSTDNAGLPVIIARAPYNLFWDRLPTVLEQLGFSVEDKNESQGTMAVKYSAPDDEYWEKLGVQPINLDNDTYKIQVGDLGNRTSISVNDDDGKPVTAQALQSLAPVLAAQLAHSN
ncbi:TPA: outer membrane protein assembly factor BamC [Photobacterium damselae]|uniref:outer membrane protein assembly factor BamC n=1 Tax=Photobacterium damselae TaxID=38293 RepID=UPI00370A09A3